MLLETARELAWASLPCLAPDAASAWGLISVNEMSALSSLNETRFLARLMLCNPFVRFVRETLSNVPLLNQSLRPDVACFHLDKSWLDHSNFSALFRLVARDYYALRT